MEKKEAVPEMVYERRQFETLLRLVPVALCLSSLVVTLKTHQSNQYGTLDYSNVGGFRYLAYANGICGGVSLISAFCSGICWSSNYNLLSAWMVFLLDQILTYIILGAGAVATELVYLAKNGDEEVTWEEFCSTYEKFCNRALVSVIITFVTVLVLIAISITSSYKLFSKYDPPYVSQGDGTTVFP
ncbi:hypothetical protein SUGI_0813070 [Cryptomeria japonica]|uniref:CASP-like protein 2A2 n=1 Tax=Cryptomeria japonica TaxID=3369 RepID=UPI0024146BEB|nr:CASP-like protein 2A2 [Cryptomeria japonica]GLJ39779.1 hypothetical protein SUGI_0813070 [Cryptomeria japonica]